MHQKQTTSTAPVMACQNLETGYKDKTVLSDINLSFAPGTFTSLLGPNGAGKTTLLRTLSRHLAPVQGEIFVLGKNLADISAMALARTMAVVLTEQVAPPLFTVFEFTALGRYPHTDFLGRLGPQDRHAVIQALSAVHADDLAHRPFADLSDGERQKVLVARALAQQPRLLLLDEPTIHLDLKHRVEVMAILRDLCRSQNMAVVASLHDVDVAAKVSDQVALIKNGTLSAYGPPESVLTGPAVADLYDFNSADFDRRLGGIELRSSGHRGRVFVVAGMGSGALVYRMLAKKGYAVSTGVLHTNDLDFFVARSLGAKGTSQPPMTPVNGSTTREAMAQMEACDAVIDCGFEVGPLNRRNMDLITAAVQNGRLVLSLRSEKDTMACFGDTFVKPVHCGNTLQLGETLDRLVPVPHSGKSTSLPVMEV